MPGVYGNYYVIFSHLPSSPLQLEPGLRTSKRIFLCQQGAPERRTSRLPHSGLSQPDFFNSGAHPSTGTSKSGHSITAPGDLVSSCSITDTESAGRPPTPPQSVQRSHMCLIKLDTRAGHRELPSGVYVSPVWNASSRHSNVLICRLFVPQAVGKESVSWRRHLQALGVA